MFQTSPVRLAQIAAVRGQGGRPPPTPPHPTHWREGSLSQPSLPDAFPPVLPSLNTPKRSLSNIPRGAPQAWAATCFMHGPGVVAQPATLHLATTLVCLTPSWPLRKAARRNQRACPSIILPLKDDDFSVYRRCLLSGSVGWTCLSAAIFFSTPQTFICWSQ